MTEWPKKKTNASPFTPTTQQIMHNLGILPKVLLYWSPNAGIKQKKQKSELN